jgi:hypothetical protein
MNDDIESRMAAAWREAADRLGIRVTACSAEVAGLYLSRVSDDYAVFDADLSKATLDDWGWFGPPERCPAWYTGTAWTA